MNPKPQTPHLETLRPKSRPPRQPGPPGVTEDESPGDMSDDEIPELEDIPHWPNVEAIGTEGHDLPQPLLPQHWVAVVPGTGLYEVSNRLASIRYLLIHRFLNYVRVDRFHLQNHTIRNPYGGLEDSAG
jgi:hypothetical protein